MRSNIDDELKLVDGKVRARGPIKWDPGESNLVLVVTIQQGDEVVGVSSSPPSFGVSDRKWTLTVPPTHKKFKKGPAHATAQIFATGEGVVKDVYPCDKEVQLKDA